MLFSSTSFPWHCVRKIKMFRPSCNLSYTTQRVLSPRVIPPSFFRCFANSPRLPIVFALPWIISVRHYSFFPINSHPCPFLPHNTWCVIKGSSSKRSLWIFAIGISFSREQPDMSLHLTEFVSLTFLLSNRLNSCSMTHCKTGFPPQKRRFPRVLKYLWDFC